MAAKSSTDKQQARDARGKEVERHMITGTRRLRAKKPCPKGDLECEELNVQPSALSRAFRSFSQATSEVMGKPWSFIIAGLVIIVWGITGPIFKYSDTWQLIINTGTTIVTFLMVFLIQNTQNRDARAFHLKLDELIRALEGASDEMIDLDTLSDEELAELKKRFDQIGSGKVKPPVANGAEKKESQAEAKAEERRGEAAHEEEMKSETRSRKSASR